MELRHLRYFVAVAEELSFSRAAERLHVSQPPLSRQIASLEQQLGTPLLFRTTRRVELTHAGKAFLDQAYQILEQVDQALVSTRLSAAGLPGELRIGFTAAVQDLVPVLKEFRSQYPGAGMVLQHLPSAAQIEALHQKTIDIGLVTVFTSHPKLRLLPLRRARFMAVLPEGHPLAQHEAIAIADLADQDFIVTTKAAGAGYYELMATLFDHFTPKIAIQAGDLQTVLALVAAGMGVALSPSPLAPAEGIVMRKIKGLEVALEPFVAWRTDNRSEMLGKFLAFADKAGLFASPAEAELESHA